VLASMPMALASDSALRYASSTCGAVCTRAVRAVHQCNRWRRASRISASDAALPQPRISQCKADTASESSGYPDNHGVGDGLEPPRVVLPALTPQQGLQCRCHLLPAPSNKPAHRVMQNYSNENNSKYATRWHTLTQVTLLCQQRHCAA
jgi:hypothetical protein